MIEDQLSRDERIRLEALNQANLSIRVLELPALVVIDRAKKYEEYIRGENTNATE